MSFLPKEIYRTIHTYVSQGGESVITLQICTLFLITPQHYRLWRFFTDVFNIEQYVSAILQYAVIRTKDQQLQKWEQKKSREVVTIVVIKLLFVVTLSSGENKNVGRSYDFSGSETVRVLSGDIIITIALKTSLNFWKNLIYKRIKNVKNNDRIGFCFRMSGDTQKLPGGAVWWWGSKFF